MTNHSSKLLRSILALGFLLAGIMVFWLLVKSIINSNKNYWAFLKGFVWPSSTGRVGLLLLGKSGVGSGSPDLTDTIMFASVDLSQPSVVLVSLPRDIWVAKIRAKLNSAYYWGGLTLARSLVEEIVGRPVEYGVVVDFSVFKQVVDALDGIEVAVARSFVDEKYPLAGKEKDECGGDPEYKCRYETITFTQGRQFMDGETALKFVRSRNAVGDEGTDLARDARQQAVILAIKEKLFSAKVFLNPKTIFSLKRIAAEAIETNLQPETLGMIARKILPARKEIKSFVLDEKFLMHPPISSRYDRQYVFVPKAGNWDKVQAWLESLY